MKFYKAKVRFFPSNLLIEVGVRGWSWGTAAQRALNEALRAPGVANKEHTRVELVVERKKTRAGLEPG